MSVPPRNVSGFWNTPSQGVRREDRSVPEHPEIMVKAKTVSVVVLPFVPGAYVSAAWKEKTWPWRLQKMISAA